MNEHAAVGAAQVTWFDDTPVGKRQPARRLKRLHLHGDVNIVFAFQPILKHLELERSDGADDVAVKTRADLLEELNRPLLRQLLDALDELLALHRVLRRDARKTLGREHGKVLEFELVRGVAERIADAEDAGIKQPHNVAGVRRVDDLTVLCEKLLWLRELDEFSRRCVPDAHIAVKLARRDADKGEAVAMRGVHVRLYLEYKSRKVLVIRRNHTIRRCAWRRRRRKADIRLKEVLHSEVRHRRTEEHGGEFAGIHRRAVELLARIAQQFDVVKERGGSLLSDALLPRGIIHLKHRGNACLLPVRHILGKELDAILLAVVDTAIGAIRADRPVHRIGADAQNIFQFIHQIERRLAKAVELVDKGEDGNPALTADAEKLARLRFNALRRVDDHDGAVHRHERTVRILAEILMPRRIEDVDAIAVIVELQNGGRDGDAALLFDLHPVGNSMALRLARLDRAGEMDGASVKEQLLGECRLACVRMRDDGKGTALLDFARKFFFQFCHSLPYFKFNDTGQ